MDGGRKKWVAGRERTEHRQAVFSAEDLQGERTRSLDSGRFYPKCKRRWHKSRPPLLTCGVRRNSPERSCSPWASGDLSAWWPHSGSEEHSLGQGVQRRWDVQSANDLQALLVEQESLLTSP